MRTVEEVRKELNEFLHKSNQAFDRCMDTDNQYYGFLLDELEFVVTQYVYDDIRFRLDGVI